MAALPVPVRVCGATVYANHLHALAHTSPSAVDVPGHSSGLVSALPHVFGWPSQGTHQPGIINMVNASTIKALITIFDEISAVFPSAFVHCGGDEVNFAALDRLPEAQAAVKVRRLCCRGRPRPPERCSSNACPLPGAPASQACDVPGYSVLHTLYPA